MVRGLRPYFVVVVSAIFLMSAMPVVAGGTPEPHRGPERRVPQDHSPRRAAYAGLRGASKGPCAGMFEVMIDLAGPPLCTHGPDHAPHGAGTGGTIEPETGAGRATGQVTTAGAGDEVECIEDGSSGARVQAIYAVASDQPDRYSTLVANIRQWAADVNETIAVSADQTEGRRAVRFVTTPRPEGGCRAKVDKVILGRRGDDSFSDTIAELVNRGYNDPSRKYLVWVDRPGTGGICGIATVIPDDSPGADNLNNGAHPMYARIDTSCWGHYNPSTGAPSVEAHELVHMLGAVQHTAPNSSGEGHCTDGADLMCVWPGPVRDVCARFNQPYLDCQHNDYFHTDPPSGGYVATHWNTANSSFLTGEGTLPLPPPTHARWIALIRLNRQLELKGGVGVADGFARCRKRVPVALQKRKPNGWKQIRTGKTTLRGVFLLQLPWKAGRYRVLAKKVVLPSGDVCLRGVSPRIHIG